VTGRDKAEAISAWNTRKALTLAAEIERGEKVVVPREFLSILLQALMIAKDWNAPLEYEIEVSEEYDHLKEGANNEPNWLCMYEIIYALNAMIEASEAENDHE
jgi:hypothetical protein